jgi:hypothetical protein
LAYKKSGRLKQDMKQGAGKESVERCGLPLKNMSNYEVRFKDLSYFGQRDEKI